MGWSGVVGGQRSATPHIWSLQRVDHETTPRRLTHLPFLVDPLRTLSWAPSVSPAEADQEGLSIAVPPRLDGHDAAVGIRDMRGLEVDASCLLEDEICFVDRKGVREDWVYLIQANIPPCTCFTTKPPARHTPPPVTAALT